MRINATAIINQITTIFGYFAKTRTFVPSPEGNPK